MLHKKKRVTKELFQTIMQKGATCTSPLFVFRYILQPHPQYAFVAPKSVAKKAVDRNKLRRQGYNALLKHTLPACAGIFFYKKQAQKVTFKDIDDSVRQIVSKIRL